MTEWQRTKSPIHMYGTRRIGDASGPEIFELSFIYRPSIGQAVARRAEAVQPEKTPGTGLFAVKYCHRSPAAPLRSRPDWGKGCPETSNGRSWMLLVTGGA